MRLDPLVSRQVYIMTFHPWFRFRRCATKCDNLCGERRRLVFFVGVCAQTSSTHTIYSVEVINFLIWLILLSNAKRSQVIYITTSRCAIVAPLIHTVRRCNHLHRCMYTCSARLYIDTHLLRKAYMCAHMCFFSLYPLPIHRTYIHFLFM